MGDKAPASGDYYSFSRAHPIQYADQEWLDKLMQQRFANERKIKTGEYKEGGEVDMPNDVDLTESDKKLHALIDGHRFKHSMKSGGKVESKIEGDDPDAKLHALIEARRKELRMASGGEVFKAAMKAGATEAKPIGFDKGGAAFGVFPQLKGKRSKQDPEAAKNVPVDVARGFVSGVLGMPGDLESLVRIPYDYLRSPTMSELVTGEKKSKTFAPTSEDIEKKLPFKSDTPVSRAATGAGQLAGGFYNGPGSPLKVMLNLPKAIKHGATEFAKASAAGVPRVMKPEGGNWIPGEVENAVKHLKRKTISDTDPAEVLKTFNETYTPKALEGMYEGSRQQLMEFKDLLERDVALNQWVDNNLSNYIKKQMGTEKDPIRKLADEGITHYSTEGAMRNAMNTSYQQFVENRKLRGKLGMPEQPKAKTDLGRAWEEGVDSLLDQGNMVSPKQLKGGNIYRDNPWMQKLPPDSTLYRLDRPSVDDMNLQHIMDVLREDLVTGRISPSDLKNVSIDRAVRRTHEYNQEMAKNAEAANAKKLEGMPVYKEYPNGYKWVKLEKPGDFAAESNAMGHSVRGYEPPKGHPDWVEGSGNAGSESYGLGGWEAIKKGEAQVYSLVDPKGNSHATIEAGKVRNPQYEEIEKHFDEAHKEVLAEMNSRGMDISDPTKANGLAWKRAEEIAREQGHMFVNQIKGKGNSRPIDKYDPYTQDFVTTGDWKDVRDLQNTGLKRLDEAFTRKSDRDAFEQLYPDQKYVTSDEIKTFKTKTDQDLIDQYKDWKSKVDFEDPQFKDYEGPDFISNEEYFKRYFPDDPAAQADFIRGGMDSPSMTPPERLGMKDWDTLMNEGVFSYDDVSFLTKVMPQRYLTAEDIAKAKARLQEPPLAEKRGGLIHMADGGSPTGGLPTMKDTLKNIQNYSVLDQSAPKKPNELGGVILAGASWLAGDEKTKLAKQAFGQDVTNTAIGGQKTSDVLNQLNVFQRDGGTFDPNTTVVLDIGANDIAQGVDEATIRANLNEIVSRLGDEGVKVILSGQPEAHSYDEAINRTDLQMDDLYQDIAANNPNVTLVDAMSGFLNQKDLMDESRFHLNSDDAKLAYINKFADAYKSMDTSNEDVVDIPQEIEKVTQVSEPTKSLQTNQDLQETDSMKQDFQEAISQGSNTVVDKADPFKQEFKEAITQEPVQVEQTVDLQPPATAVQEAEVSSGPDYSRAYKALGGQEVVNNLYNQFLGMGLDEDTIGSVFSKYYSPESDATLMARRGGAIRMAPGGLIRNLLKMTPKEEALAKLPQMKAESAAKQALEAEYKKAMREVPYDQQITLKEWEATRLPSASEANNVVNPTIPKAKGGLTKLRKQYA
jgi:hypothetical protein